MPIPPRPALVPRLLVLALFLTAYGPLLVAQAQPAMTAEVGWPGTTWPTSTPEAEGIDPAALQALVADLEAGAYGLVDHFLLLRHGRIVADHHFTHDYATIGAQYDTTDYIYNYDHPNWHPYYQGTELHTLQSVTKSVTSAALGIALDEGLIDGVEVSVMDFFGDYDPDLTDDRRRAITLEDLLTMRSGIEWQTTGGYSASEHSTIKMELSDAWMPFILAQPMDATPGTAYEYNDGASVLIGHILRQATGQRADQWAAERLFKPLGITDYFWKITPAGEADTEGGLYLKPHDLARIGYLFLREGRWGDQQVVSSAWVRASTTPVVPSVGGGPVGYGYQWWVPGQQDGQTTIFAGNGYGGQFLQVMPEHDLVVVFNGWNIHGGAQQSSWRALQERIVPAVQW